MPVRSSPLGCDLQSSSLQSRRDESYTDGVAGEHRPQLWKDPSIWRVPGMTKILMLRGGGQVACLDSHSDLDTGQG